MTGSNLLLSKNKKNDRNRSKGAVMSKRNFSDSELKLTEVGFGAWAIGGPNWAFGWGPQNDTEAIAAIRRGMELDVNWIDTAAVYGLGHSEELVAKAVKGHRKEVIIATKCSLIWDESGNISSSLSAESVRRECEQSLKRLNTDFIDIYQIHWPTDDKRIEEGWDMIGRLMEEGKIRHAGVSNFNKSQLERVMKVSKVESLQPPYSMFRREIESELLEYCSENKISVLAYSPMQSGLLTGKFNIIKLAENDWRLRSNEFVEPNLTINLEFVEKLRPLAEKYNMTVAALAIAWTLRREEITSTIVGARRPSQIEQTAEAVDCVIEEEDLKAIDGLLVKRKKEIKKKKGYL
jgi:aryl-alcohol dehydrogenase-like predicted oxidoreductase